MNKNIVLSLKSYAVKHMALSLNDNFTPKATQIDLHPDIHRFITPIDADSASVVLSFEIKNDSSLPFSMKIEIEGVFSLNAWKEDKNKTTIMTNNTVAILFPYLRALVTLLTANANIPPYILPVMNINALLKELEGDLTNIE